MQRVPVRLDLSHTDTSQDAFEQLSVMEWGGRGSNPRPRDYELDQHPDGGCRAVTMGAYLCR
jgi:hypothetical protein